MSEYTDTELLTASMPDNEESRSQSRSTTNTVLSDDSENPLSSDSAQNSSDYDITSKETTWPSQNSWSARQTDAEDLSQSDSTRSRNLSPQNNDNSDSSANFLKKQFGKLKKRLFQRKL
ncbi:MAG: hypothetical protein MHMPM18_002703 [Marteilia pararefringens]